MSIVSSFASRFGYQKKRAQKSDKRGFSAAQVNRLTSSWTVTPKPIDADIRKGLRIARARARDAAQNNDYAKHYLRLVRSNVVGPQGIITIPQNKSPNGELDTLANDAIKDAFNLWGAFGSPEVTGKFSWAGIQGLFVETVARDGECFLRIHRNWNQNKFSFALEFIDAEAVDPMLNKDLGNGRSINMGIELDEFRRPVFYYVQTTAATSDLYGYYGKKYKRIPASDIIHGFLPEAVLQTRGFPWLAISLMRSNMLQGYEEAELVAARAASAKMGFLIEDPESVGDKEYEGDEDTDGAILTDAEPGTIERLPAGLKFESWDPSHPSTAFEGFVKANLRGMAAGLGVSYFTLANDLEGVNYNSGRLGSLEDRELWKALQTWLTDFLIRRVSKEWLPLALLTGQISIGPTPLKSSNLKRYTRLEFQGRRWAWVDPKKDMEGHGLALDRKLISPQVVIREQGRDVDQVLDDWEEWEKKLELRKLTVTLTAPPPKGKKDDEED